MTAACPGCTATQLPLNDSNIASRVLLSIPSIKCAACIAAIETQLNRLPGVQDARVNLTLKRVAVSTDLDAEQLISSLSELGYDAFPLDSAALGQTTDAAGRDLLLRLGVAGFAMMNVMLLSVAVWSGAQGATRDLFHLISSAIALPVVLFSAQPFFRQALAALRHARLNMDVPISLAILLAGGMSLYETLHGGHHAYFDAALSLTFFLLIGRYLEHRTRSAAHSAARELAALEVNSAQRKKGLGYETVPSDALRPDDVVHVATGMRVPADGALISHTALTDRSFLTGESAPVAHHKTAALNAGEINLGAPFEFRVTAAGQNTRLHQMAAMIEIAETARNSYTSLADRAARIYAPAVHVLAAVTFAGWLMASGDIRQSLNIAIAVLIITCPCALGLAVPAVSTAAIARLYKLGFLVKSGTALERLAEVETVVFDKTGTLTTPTFEFDLTSFSLAQKRIAKTLAQSSSHPLSRALDQHLSGIDPVALADVEETISQGVSARFDERPVALGRAHWLGGASEGLALRVGAQLFALTYRETIRAGAQNLVQNLIADGYATELLSGDTEDKTGTVARSLGIPSWSADVSPEAKHHHIARLEETGAAPCMVGDGLNDTVALACAHASIAPGSGLDAARSAADVVMLGNSLPEVPKVFSIAKMAVRISRQNFAIALAYNAIAIPIAIAGFATPFLAAIAMSASSITVLVNAMRVNMAAK